MSDLRPTRVVRTHDQTALYRNNPEARAFAPRAPWDVSDLFNATIVVEPINGIWNLFRSRISVIVTLDEVGVFEFEIRETFPGISSSQYKFNPLFLLHAVAV